MRGGYSVRGNDKSMTKKKLLILIACTGVALASGSAYMLHRGFSARDQPTAMEAMAAHTARSLAVPTGVRSMQSPFPADEAALQEARMNWAQNCALCHANNGSGDTPIGQNLYPKPPDLRAIATQGQTDGELYAVIQNGVRLTGMPAWGEVRPDDRDRWNLVAFIRHLPKLTPEEEREMERYNPRIPDDPAPAPVEKKKSGKRE